MELIFTDRKNVLKSYPTILLNLIMTITVIVKLFCETLSEKRPFSLYERKFNFHEQNVTGRSQEGK